MDKKEYTNGEITVVWKAEKCIHSGNCVKGLPGVFKPKERPWIQLETVSSEEIKNTIDKCPSGALSYYINDEKTSRESKPTTHLELIENGPLIVHGPISIKSGNEESTLDGPRASICRCGASSKKPFCDGSHKKIDFKS